MPLAQDAPVCFQRFEVQLLRVIQLFPRIIIECRQILLGAGSAKMIVAVTFVGKF